MNEQAIQDAYNLFVQTGYKGDVNAFSNLIKTNPNALNDSYNLFVDNGYNKGYDEYKTLVGVNQAQSADLLKKKEQGPMAQMVPQNTTESFVEESLSASQPKVQVAPKAQVAPKQKPSILAQPVTQNTTESFLATASAVPSIQPIEAKKPKVVEKPKEEEGQGWLMNTISSLDKGFYKNLLGNPIKALGTGLQYTSGKLTGTDGKAFLSDALINFGDYFNNAIDELTPQDKEFKNSLSDQFGQAFGQVVSQIITAGATNVGKGAALVPEIISQEVATKTALKEISSELASPSSISSGLVMGQSEFDRAKAAGATDEQAFEAFYKNAAVGSILERVPVMQFMKRFNQASKGGLVDFIKTKGVAGTVGGLEEMSTEVLQQVYANKTAQEIYNTNQDLFEGIAESGGVGFGVGFLLNAMGANAKLLKKNGSNAEAQLLENQVVQFEEQAKNGGPSSYKFNGINMQSADVIEKMIESMDANQLAKANIEITNDPVLKAKLQDKIVSSSIKEQVKKANPDLNEPSLNAIIQLELDLQKLQGNTTQSGKDKAAAIRGQIKNIQENQLQEESATETLNAEKNAIQEQTAGQVPVQSETGTSLQVAEGEPQAEPQGVTQEGQGKEVVFQEVTFDDPLSLYQDKKKVVLNDEEFEFNRLNTSGEENVFTIEKDGEEIGRATLDVDGNYLTNIRVDENYRRQGLGTVMYDYIENQANIKLKPSPAKQSKAAEQLWVKRNQIKVAPQENQAQVETLRAQEQTELMDAIPNATQYVVDGKVDRTKISDPKDLKAFDAIYDKYDKLITPLLETTEVSSETQTTPIQQNEQAPSTIPITKLATAEEVIVEDEEQYEPITIKDTTHDTFTRDNASDYEEDEKDGDNGRSYTYLSSITVPIMNQDGDTIGYLVKMSDGDGELTFDAENEDGSRISKNDEGYLTLGDAKKAFVEAYNKTKKKEFDKEAKAKAKQKAKQAEKVATKAAKDTVKKDAAKVEEVQAIVDELLALDPNDESTAQKISDSIGKAIKDIEKFEKTSLGVNIALPIVKGILQAIKVLIDAGISLQQAFKQVAKDNNITEQQVKDNINIAPILGGFGEVMTKVDALIARQKPKGIAEVKIISNVDTFIRNTEVYQAANDAQKKILEREGRAKMGVDERRAPSIGRVLGALKDFTNISREEKIQIIKQIRILSQNAAKSLSKEINELASSGKITPKQVAAVINRFGKVNLLNEISVANFVDYMAKVFNDAEYADKVSVAKKQLAIAKKNIETKIGMADGLMIPLRKMLAINPSIIPDSVFDEYLTLVDMFGQRRTVLSLDEKSELTKQVNGILESVNKEQFEVDGLAFVMSESENVVYSEDGSIDFAETLKKMVEKGDITQEDADLMRKYKSSILPQVEPEPKNDKENEAEKQDLLQTLGKTQLESSGLPSRDERNLANKLAKLIRTDAVKSLTNAELKNLLRVIDNINNNFLPHYASLMEGKLNGINNGKTLSDSIAKAIPLPVSKFASRVKSFFTKENNPAFEMIKRGPQMSIDEILGDFKSNNVFKSLFEAVSEAAATYKTEIRKIQNILEEAEDKIAKSFLRNQEKITMSKYKIMTYLIQLEYDSNPNNPQVNPAADYINKTIKLIQSEKSQYNKKDIDKFQSILDKYNDGKGGIDSKKLYNSFNPAEKSAIKDIRGINESLAQQAAFTASVIRGDKFNPLNNYVHLNVLSDTGLDESFTPDYMASFDDSMRPSTKAKSLIERTKGAKALNFDAFASAQRGANFVLMDYNLTPAVREARITLNQTESNLQQQANEKAGEQAKKNGVKDEAKLKQIEGVVPQKERRIFNALVDAFDLATSDLLQTSSLSNSLVDEGVDYITKTGYRTTLAGTGRFAAELLSNLYAVTILDPVAYYDGVADFGKFSMNEDAATFMINVKSKSTSRLYGANPLSGRIVDTNILNQASGMKGAKSIGDIENMIMQAWNLSGKKVINGIELTADALVATPDKVVSIPFWFGSFAKKFKQITGEDIDRQKVVEDNEAYINKYADEISEAKNFADTRATIIASTDNPYMNILKGKSKKEQTALTKAFNVFNSFLTNFNIVDFYNLRRGIYSLMGKGMLSKTEGARLIAAVAGRSIIYLTLGKLFGDGILGMIGGDDEEKEEDNTWYQMVGQAIASTATSAFIGRDFGNAVRLLLNSAIEYGNEQYLDFLRTGPYDRFKDSIQFSAIPSKKGNLPLGLIDFALPLSGPLQPALKTTDFIIKTWTADDKKEAAAKERQDRNKYIRTPIEIAGNLGAILMYKDVRKYVMKDINKSLIQEQKDAADKKSNKLRLLQGFKNQEDMQRYEPELWDRTYGPSSEGYDARQEVKKLKREQDKLEQAIKDEERGYTPAASKRRGTSTGFGPQEGSSKSGFGPQKNKGKSEFGSKDGFGSK